MFFTRRCLWNGKKYGFSGMSMKLILYLRACKQNCFLIINNPTSYAKH
jgi:hypothetical protein